MEPINIVSITISIISLAVATFAAYKTYVFNHLQFRLINRNEFQKIYIEIDKELIREPCLWAIYDSHPIAKKEYNDLIEKARLEAFVYMHLNMFELAFIFFHESKGITKAEKKTWQGWDEGLKDFIRDSSLAREIISQPEILKLYSSNFLNHIKSYISKEEIK